MACHLAGVPTAVATCGTSFGRRPHPDPAPAADGPGRVPRRGDLHLRRRRGRAEGGDAGLRGGRSASSRRRSSRSSPTGCDPCELRLAKGDAAVRDLVARRVPLFEFDLRDDARPLRPRDGRGPDRRRCDAAAPIVAGIRDRALRPEYARQLAGWLGMDVDDGPAPGRRQDRSGRGAARRRVRPAALPGTATPDPDDPRLRVEREALKVVAAAARAGRRPAWDALEPDAVHRRRLPRRAGRRSTRPGGPQARATADRRSWPACATPRPTTTSARWSPSWPSSRCARPADRRATLCRRGTGPATGARRSPARIQELKGRLQRLNPVEQAETTTASSAT